jgi:ethanolamine utilization protein EutN
MFLARVIGNVVATVKDPSLEGAKLLVIEPASRQGGPDGTAVVALDTVGAGEGEWVTCCRGREASFPWRVAGSPVDVAIIGIVESFTRDDGWLERAPGFGPAPRGRQT